MATPHHFVLVSLLLIALLLKVETTLQTVDAFLTGGRKWTQGNGGPLKSFRPANRASEYAVQDRVIRFHRDIGGRGNLEAAYPYVGEITGAGRTMLRSSNNDEDRMKALHDIAENQKLILQDPEWNASLPLIDIKDLHAESADDHQPILKGVNLRIFKGEKHAIMGRNGSGKSTLSKVVAGHPGYNVISGSIQYKGVDLLSLPVDYRALAGVFLAFQYPVEIPMVKNSEFLRVALNEKRKYRNETEIEPLEFNMMMYEKLQHLGLNEEFIERPLNYGFSGGEKKRNEILQMLILEPELCLLDETDSGLDVDSFRITAQVVKEYGGPDKSFLIVTHYKKLLDFLTPDYVHVMHQGKIVKVGDVSIAAKLEDDGFAQFLTSDS